jgi:formiminotetrahydrofolate cyclodeaminase
MVAALPKPRAASAEELDELRRTGARSAALARDLETLIDRDSDAYDGVMAAYRLPKATDTEKSIRGAGIQDALKAATDTPLEVMRASAEALRLASTVERLGNANAASDVTVAIHLLRAAIAGAAANVEINLGSVKDTGYVARVREELARLTTDWRPATAD